MRRAAVSLALAFGVGVVCAGCTDDEGEGPTAAPSNTSSTTTTTTVAQTPLSSSARQVTPGVLMKEVGEESAFGGGSDCTAQNRDACLVRFVVTDVRWQSDATCRSSPADGSAYLYVAVDVTAAPMLDSQSGMNTALAVPSWGAIDAEGYSSKAEPAGMCDYVAGPFYAPLLPGTKQRGDIVIEVPVTAESLYLAPPVIDGRWEWPIPPATT